MGNGNMKTVKVAKKNLRLKRSMVKMSFEQ